MQEDKVIDVLSYFQLDSSIEHESLECKEAGKGLPHSLWETYSAFANTDGGVILLGIREQPKGVFSVNGVENPQDLVNTFWASCSNMTTVNRNILSNSDVQILTDVTKKKIIMITVPQAPLSQMPVFIKGHMELSFIRHGESDVKATQDELKALIRNSQNTVDSLPLVSFSMEDLDIPTVTAFKSIVASRFPVKGYENKSNEEFLIELGFFGQERATKTFHPKQGCLLLFGKYNAIKDFFPSYHLDYIDYRNSDSRWSDRVASDMSTEQEMNLYNFFNIAYNKLIAADKNSFELDDKQVRVEHSLIVAIREALVNMIVHADYAITGGSLKIEVYEDHYNFRNPGKMLVSVESFERGGSTICRNETIMRAFRFLGFSERQGMGGKEIVSTAIRNKLMLPTIITNLEFTEIKLWKIDAASYPELSHEEQAILRYIIDKTTPVSKTDLKHAFPQYTDYRIKTTMASLLITNKIVVLGKGKATKYMLAPTSMELRWKLQKMITQLWESF